MQDSDLKRWSLRQVDFVVLTNAFCNSTHTSGKKRKRKNVLPDWFTGPLMCAHDGARSIGSCKGDSGAPGFTFNYVKKRYQLRAVLHGGFFECNNRDYPAIFNDVHDNDIMSFITKQLSEGD